MTSENEMKLDAFLPTRGGFDCWMEVKSSQINPIYVTHLKTTAVVPKCFTSEVNTLMKTLDNK